MIEALLLSALIAVESSGDTSAYRRDSHAAGPLQIRPIVVRDVNQIYGTHYWLSDRFDGQKSCEMALLYLRARGGKTCDPERWARTWKGGPDGHLDWKTRSYWIRVRREMDRTAREIVKRRAA